MARVWIIARHEYLINARRLGFLITTLSVPALGIIGLLVAALVGGQMGDWFTKVFPADGTQTTVHTIGIVDRSGICSPLLPDYNDGFTLFSTEDEGLRALRADQILHLLVIPREYLASGKVHVINKQGGLNAMRLKDSAVIRRFIIDHLLRHSEDTLLKERLANPLEIVPVRLDEETRATRDDGLAFVVNMMTTYFLAILLVFTIFTSSGYLLRGVSEEKTSRIIEIILSSVAPWELLAGKVLGLGALGLTQIAVWLLSAAVFLGGAFSAVGLAPPTFDRVEVFGLALVYYVLGFLVFAVLMGAAGAVGTTMQESQQLAGIFSLVAVVPMILSGMFFANPGLTAFRVLSWFPLTAPVTMMMRLSVGEAPNVDIILSIFLLIVSIPGVIWVGAKVFRMGLLMYGKRPSVGQIIQWLREA
ncbi:MAG: ABC transporter permease [Candidatus Methanosuratus sp.]|nr:ABC transporter permease [Candidatus Methanosuratincola sp.]